MDQQSTETTIYYEYFIENIEDVHKNHKDDNKFITIHEVAPISDKVHLLNHAVAAPEAVPVEHPSIQVQYLTPLQDHLLPQPTTQFHQIIQTPSIDTVQQLPPSIAQKTKSTKERKKNGTALMLPPLPTHRRYDEPKISCSVCNQVLKNKKGLKLHMQIHEGVKRFLCQMCPKSFLRSNHLKSHMKVHTGERPYTCEVLILTD